MLHVEKASFTPLVYSTLGGMGPQAAIFHKKLARLISEKRHEQYSDVINYMRTRLSFSLLKSILISVRGNKGKLHKAPETPVSCVSFNMIPELAEYDMLRR